MAWSLMTRALPVLTNLRAATSETSPSIPPSLVQNWTRSVDSAIGSIFQATAAWFVVVFMRVLYSAPRRGARFIGGVGPIYLDHTSPVLWHRWQAPVYSRPYSSRSSRR
jgi:hypothetical protein